MYIKSILILLLLLPTQSYADYTCRAVVRKDKFVTEKFYQETGEISTWTILINRYQQGERADQTLRQLVGTSVSYLIPFEEMSHENCQQTINQLKDLAESNVKKISIVGVERSLFSEDREQIRTPEVSVWKQNSDLPGEQFHTFVNDIIQISTMLSPAIDIHELHHAQYEEVFTCAFHCTNYTD